MLVVAEARSKVTIVEEHAGGAAGYLNGVVEIVVGDGAQVDYSARRTCTTSTVHFTTARAEIGRDAALRWTAIDLGGDARQGAHGVAALAAPARASA